MSTELTIGLAQMDSRLGAVEANLTRHLEWIERAREQGVDLLVFPELSLTGYRLLHLTSRVATRLDDLKTVASLLEASRDISLVVGLVEEGSQGVLYNSALLIEDGEIRHVHRKRYLPTYGIFQEGRFFGRGREVRASHAVGWPVGTLICEDLWHPHLARELAVRGAKLLVVTSAAPGRLGAGPVPESQRDWESLTHSSALVNTCWVLYCNRVGWEEGSFYTGGSHIVRPGGELLTRAPYLEEDLLVATIDPREVDRLRWRLPLVEAARDEHEELS